MFSFRKAMWRLILRVVPFFLLTFFLNQRFVSAQVTVSLPDLQVSSGGSEMIAVNVSDLTNHEVTSFEFTISYDPTVVEIIGVSSAGTLTDSVVPIVNTTTSGEVSIAWANAFGLTGAGVLVNLEASFLQEGSSPLTFETFRFNEGEPTSILTNGQVTVGTGTSGSVNISLPGSTLGTEGGSQLVVPISVSDVTGKNVTSYSFTLLYDAEIVDVASYSTLGTISSGASPVVNTTTPGQILVTWAAGTALTGAGVLGNLLINPVAEGISALTLSAVQFNSGDPTASIANGSVTIESDGPDVHISLAELSGLVGETLPILLATGDVTGRGVNAFNTTIDYDASIVQFSAFDQVGTITEGNNATVDTSTPGRLVINWSGSTLNGAGALLELNFSLLNPGATALTVVSFAYNGGGVPTTTDDGAITVTESGKISVSMPTGITGDIGQQVSIPVNTGDLTGQGVFSYTFTVVYNPDDVNITGASVAGTLSANNSIAVNTDVSGQIVVSLTSVAPISGAGVLVNLDAQLLGPGSSGLSFTSFQYNGGTPEVTTIDGSVSVSGFSAHIQIVHNSSDAPPVDIYVDDVRYIDDLSYGSATAFLELITSNVKIDVVKSDEANNLNPITTSSMALASDSDYVAVINGLYTGSGKQAIGMVVQASQQEATDANSVGLNVFQGSPDAPNINAYIVDDTEAFNRILTLAKGLGFGDSFLTKEFEPGVYNIELTENSGTRIGIYRADLSRTGGAALLFMVQGFVNPIVGQPDLSITAYAPDGSAIFLPLATANEDEFVLPNAFSLEGNYPNPFNPTTSVAFNLPEPAQVNVEVFDMLGRLVLNTPARQFHAGSDHAIQLDASSLSSGTYVYRLVAEGVQQMYTESKTMTLLK